MLHEPLRWHPSLVQILGIQWGLSPLTESVFPILFVECSSHGTLRDFQTSVEPLSFSTKQNLCYDMGKGLSILHSCGIVHGDVKHENVHIFPNHDPATTVLYKAKLTDFGGTVMNMRDTEVRRMGTWTWPFQAPEVDRGELLTREGMMLTDIYSFGLLIWRTFTDGRGILSCEGADCNAPDQMKGSLKFQKSMEDFTSFVIADIYRYAESRSIPKKCVDLIAYAVLQTLRVRPSDGCLTSAQAALRGIK
jgi:serine/threonine protein kinase